MASDSLLIKNGRVIDPGRNLDRVADVLVQRGRISRISMDSEVTAALIPEDRVSADGVEAGVGAIVVVVRVGVVTLLAGIRLQDPVHTGGDR